MEQKNTPIWMVRSGEGGYLVDEFLKDGIVAIGWNETGALPDKMSYEALKELIANTYGEFSPGKVNQTAGQMWRFYNEFKPGDIVVTYDSDSRLYYTGIIKSGYLFNADFEYSHYRKVEWDDTGIDRDTLTPGTKNVLGSVLTIFSVSPEILRELEVNHPGYISDEEQKEIEEIEKQVEEEEEKRIKEETISKSIDFIKDIISKLSWQDTERLVAGILKALGYKTRMTSKGGDLGSDILASPDELALEEPRIKVEVKKRTKDKISPEEIRSFIGGMRDYNKGVYVTTTGFSKEARYEAERSNIAITLIDSDWLVELIVSNYETLDTETKALIPLKKIYWPV